MSRTFSNTTAGDNTEVVVTITTTFDSRTPIRIRHITFSFDEDPSAAKALTIESPSGTTIFSTDVTKGGPGPINFSSPGFPGANGQDVLVKLAAGGAGIAGKLNVIVDE